MRFILTISKVRDRDSCQTLTNHLVIEQSPSNIFKDRIESDIVVEVRALFPFPLVFNEDGSERVLLLEIANYLAQRLVQLGKYGFLPVFGPWISSALRQVLSSAQISPAVVTTSTIGFAAVVGWAVRKLLVRGGWVA